MSREMVKKILTIIFIILSIQNLNGQTLSSQNINPEESSNKKFFSDLKLPEFTPRRLTGLAYSCFVPGSGQIYLGYKTKGAAFAIGFFTGLVGAVVAQNNYIGNRERIESLQFDYLNADRYTLAEYYWKQMVSVHNEQKTHERARNIFAIATAILWTANILDYLFLTEDKGPIEFSYQNDFNNSNTLISVKIPIKK
jgi:TM2 domain-containing membrane protein YozV